MRPVDLVQAVTQARPDASQVGWFAARQPGIVSFLEARCGAADALAVALEAAWRVCCAFEARDGTPPARVASGTLERIAAWLAEGAELVGDGASRPPELVAWVGRLLASPPLPLSPSERHRVGVALLAVVYAVDELSA